MEQHLNAENPKLGKSFIISCTVYTCMLGAKHGFVQSVDCPAHSVDPCFALAIHRMTHDCTIPGLRTHDEREGPLLATLLAW